MSSLNCLCGHRINTSVIPNENGYDLIAEALHETLIETLIAAFEESESREELSKRVFFAYTHLQTPGILQIYECPQCSRIAVFARASDPKPTFWYRLEQALYPEEATSIHALVEKLQHGDLARYWQSEQRKSRMKHATPLRLSTSTWSVHRALGVTYPDAPGKPNQSAEQTYGAGTLTLLELPQRLTDMGIGTLEICHFHIPRNEAGYLDRLRGALNAAGVELFSLLIDDGDITHPEYGDRDCEWIASWIDTAGALGAKRVRVIAGKQPPSGETLARSRAALETLVARGTANNLRVMTENWFSLLSRPEDVHGLLGGVDVGLCADFGNWGGASKYDDLNAIFPLAESCHAKCAFAPEADRVDYTLCLEGTRAAGFSGPYTLIYDGPNDDEWAGLRVESEMVLPFVGA
jgi:sugar phosphate isomerase/epimerase